MINKTKQDEHSTHTNVFIPIQPQVQKQEKDETFRTLGERVIDATMYLSHSLQRNTSTMDKVTSAIDEYINCTDVTVAPPDTAAQEPPTAVRPDNATLKPQKRFTIRQISVRNIDGAAGLWFNVWWVNCKNPTAESVTHLVNEGIDLLALQQIAHKGFKAKPTIWGGCFLRSGREYPAIGSSSAVQNSIDWVPPYQDFITEVDVKFQHQGARCVPYAFLNVYPGTNKKKKEKLMFALNKERCSLGDLCNPVGKVFQANLQKVHEDIDWVISQTHGNFLVFDTIHCVGVDCDRGLIFDSSMPKAFRLCKDAFHHCNITKPEDVRLIVAKGC